MKFQQYKKQRDKTEFENSFTALCEKMVMGNVSFEDWWIKNGIPVVAESYKYNSPEQLLNELGVFDRMKGWFGQQPQAQGPGPWQKSADQYSRDLGNNHREIHNPNARDVTWDQNGNAVDLGKIGPVPQGYNPPPEAAPQQMAPQKPQLTPQQQQKIAQYQQRADQEVNVLKKKFAVAMRDFVKTVTDDAQNSGDHHSWQIARKFCDKINQATQPVVQAFSMKAALGKADYKGQFDQARGQMQGNQQANAQQALRDKYSQGKPLQDLMQRRLNQSTGMSMGPDGQVPQGVQDMQSKMQQGYDPFNPANYAAPQAPAATPVVKGPRRRRGKGVNPATGTNGMSFESVQDDVFVESLVSQTKRNNNFSIMGF